MRFNHSRFFLRFSWTLFVAAVIAASPPMVLESMATVTANEEVDLKRLEEGLIDIQSFDPYTELTNSGEQVGLDSNVIVQSPDGVVYVGNAGGVLQFDGSVWRLVKLPGVPASLAIDPDTGRVYVGLKSDFGYLHPGSEGRLVFVSLLHRVPEQDRAFSEVWKTYVSARGVVFAAVERLFLVTDDEIHVWRSESGLHSTYQVNDRVIVFEHGRGLLELGEKGLEILPGGEALASEYVAAVLPRPELGNDALLVCTRSNGFFVHDGSTLHKMPSDADSIFSNSRQQSGVRLGDGRLVLSSYSDGIYILDKGGRLLSKINAGSGLPSNVITSLYVDKEGGLWVTTSQGLARLDVGSPDTWHDKRIGLYGKIEAMHQEGGDLYVATDEGLFLRRAGSNPNYSRVEGIAGISSGFIRTSRELLVGTQFGIYEVTGSQVSQVFQADLVSGMALFGDNEDRLVVGTRRALIFLNRIGSSFSVEAEIGGVEAPRRFFQSSDGWLWFTGQYGNVGRVRMLDSSQNKFGATVETFGQEHGLESPPVMNHVTELDGQMRVINPKGVLLFNEQTTRFDPDPAFSQLFSSTLRGPNQMAQAEDKVWMISDSVQAPNLEQLWLAVRDDEGIYQHDPRAPQSDINGSTLLAVDSAGVWMGGQQGLARVRTTDYNAQAARLDVAVRQVSTSKRSVLLAKGETGDLSFDPTENRIKLRYSAINYSARGRIEYRTLLEGFDASWSPWSLNAQEEYANLWEGTYVFRLEARIPSGLRAISVPYRFRVLPPWYRSSVAYVIYACLFILLANGLLSWRTRHILAQRNHLRNRLSLIQSQLEPHFLFNALSAISSLVRSDRQKECLKAITMLSSLLRYALMGSRRTWVTLDEELVMVADYVALQQLRFGHRVTFTMHVAEEVKQFPCPTLLLQPLVENAVRHGVEATAGGAHIELHASKVPNGLHVQVRNTVASNAVMKGFGVGLSSVRERVKLLYGDAGTVTVYSQEGAFVASIYLRERKSAQLPRSAEL